MTSVQKLLIFLLLVVSCPSVPAVPSKSAPVIQVKDLNGALVRPFDSKGRKATVLFFIAHDCPISNGYAPEISRTCREYGARNVALYVVYVEPSLSVAAARAHARAYGYALSAALLDPKHRLVKHAGATITPEAAIFSPDGRLRYRGRIDDRYPSLGQRREVVTTHDLRASLEAVLAGKPVPVQTTTAVGCFIPPSS